VTRRYISFVIRHRIAVLVACVSVTVAATWMVSRGVLASSVIQLFFGEDPKYEAYRELANRFSDSDLAVFAFEHSELFTADGWHKLERVVAGLEEVEAVRRVDAVTNAYRIRGEDDLLAVDSYNDLVADGIAFEELRHDILADELLRGLLVSEDGRYSMVLIELTDDADRPVEKLPEIMEQLYGPFEAAGFSRQQLHPAGLLPETIETTAQARYSIYTIFPIVVLLLSLIVYLLFLQVWPVAITMGVSMVANLWTFAFAVMLDRDINIMMAMVPAVMLVVAFSDIIHLCSAYLLELRAGLSKADAILESGSEVGRACLFTSLTTLVGFASLAFVPTPVIRKLATVLAFGVALALILAMTLVPILFSLLPAPKAATWQKGGPLVRLVDRVIQGALALSTRRAWQVIVGFAIVLVVSLMGISRIRIETKMIDRLNEDNPIRQSAEFIEKQFAGTTFLDVYFTAKEGDFLEPERFVALSRLQEEVLKIADVDEAQSFVDVIDRIHNELAGPDAKLPDSRAMLAQYLLLFDMSGGGGIERLIDEERLTVRMTVRLSGPGMVRTADLGKEIARQGRELFGPSVDVSPGGLTYLFGDWIGFIVDGQKQGLLFAFFATTLMMIVALRLWGAGLLSMIPNALPILVLGGVVGWTWDSVDSDTIMVAMIAIGIGVDDTIHFTTRLRMEAARTNDLFRAMQRTFNFTGRAIIMTSIILCLGFAPFATSAYFTTKIMGTLLPMTLLVALVADLLLLPALIEVGVIRIPLGGDTGSSQLSS